MLSSQKHLFDIPDEVAYLNTAYMSPLMHSVVAEIDEGVVAAFPPLPGLEKGNKIGMVIKALKTPAGKNTGCRRPGEASPMTNSVAARKSTKAESM